MIHSRCRYGASLTYSPVGVTSQYTRRPTRVKAAVYRQPRQIIRSIITITHVGEVRIVVDRGIVTEFIDRFGDSQSLRVNIVADSAELVIFLMHLKNMIPDPGDPTDDLHQKNHRRRDRQPDQRLHLPAHHSPPCGTYCKYQWRQARRPWSPDSPYQRF